MHLAENIDLFAAITVAPISQMPKETTSVVVGEFFLRIWLEPLFRLVFLALAHSPNGYISSSLA